MDNPNEYLSNKRKYDALKVKPAEISPIDESPPAEYQKPSGRTPDPPQDLPPHWIKCKSKRMGRDYYFNTATGVTIWEHPNFYYERKKHLPDLEKCSSKHISPLKREKMRANNHKSDEFRHSFSTESDTKSFDHDSFLDVELESVGAKEENWEHPTTHHSISMESLSPDVCEVDGEEPMEIDVVEKFRSKLPQTLSDPVSFVEDTSIPWDIVSVDEDVAIYLIIDTNVFISNLNFVDSLRHLRFGAKSVVVVVPYIVLQELDVLKDRRAKNNSNIKEDALVRSVRAAINFIYREMSIKSSFLLCQPSNVDAEKFKNIETKRNDDRVLKCYAQLSHKKKEARSTTTVMLCTNDKNLLTKSYANDIVAGTESQLKILLPDIAADPVKYLPPSTSSQNVDQLQNAKKDINANSLDLTKVKCLFDYSRQVLSTIVEDEFRRVYKENADVIFVIKPPWFSLKIVVEVILKHWTAVYRYIWQDDGVTKWIDRFHALYKILILNSLTIEQETDVLKMVAKVLEQFSQRITCPNIVAVNRLLGAVQKFIKNQEKSPSNEQSQNVSRRKRTAVVAQRPRATVEEVCDRIWRYIEESKNACVQTLIQSLQGDDVQHRKAENDLRLLYMSTDTLVDLMDAVFRCPTDGSELFHHSVENFCKFMNNFIETLSGEKQIFQNTLDTDIFETFIAIESNREVFLQAGGHLMKLIQDMKQKLVAFGTTI